MMQIGRLALNLLLDLLAGGTDTSATTIEWAFHELIKQPKMIKKEQKELDRVIGDGCKRKISLNSLALNQLSRKL